jgi:hypothetical protein
LKAFIYSLKLNKEHNDANSKCKQIWLQENGMNKPYPQMTSFKKGLVINLISI